MLSDEAKLASLSEDVFVLQQAFSYVVPLLPCIAACDAAEFCNLLVGNIVEIQLEDLSVHLR